jgi:hypothetical protein
LFVFPYTVYTFTLSTNEDSRYAKGVKSDTHTSPEFQKFDSLLGKLLAVPHSELKAKLEEEKKAKEERKPKPSASSRVVSDRAR